MGKRQLPLFPAQPTTSDDISKHTPLAATFDHFQAYLLKEGKSTNTVKAFMGDLRLVAEHSDAQTPVGQFTTSSLNEFLEWMEHQRGVSCSRKTYARRVTTLKVYFKWLRALNAIPHDPAAAILQRSGPAPLSHVLTPKQVRAVLEVAQLQKKGDEFDNRPLFLFELLLQTGIKKSETGRLTLADFDRSKPDQPQVMIRHKAKNVYKERRIALAPEILPLLDAYVTQYRPQETLFTCTTRNLEYIITALGEQAGVPFKLSFEVMRWTMGVRDLRMGLEEDTIRAKMGLSETSWYETGGKIRRLVSQQVNQELDAQA